MQPVGVGIIGCGNISPAYLRATKKFPILDIVALADLNPAAAEARSAEFGVPARSIEALLADPAIEIVLNLTVPKAHVEVGLRAVAAGKHVHSEKPLGINIAEAGKLIAAGEARGVRIGCAPDTFLGGSHQTARKLIDEGAIGRPIGGAAFFMCPGHERWHPDPGFYYLSGGGPMLDMGPYYITDLVNLLGPVARVGGMATRLRGERVITSEPLKGKRIPVEIATHVTGTLEFVDGAVVTITMSFDVAAAQTRADRDLRRKGVDAGSRPQLFLAGRSSWRAPARIGASCRPNIPMPTSTTASSASPTWRRRSARIVRTGRAARWPITCLKSWRRFSGRPIPARS